MSAVTDATRSIIDPAGMAEAQRRSESLVGDTQERFLTLLVTQLQNQDPLNPMDNSEVTSQIAQLSTVNGINQLNNTLLALSGQMDASQSMQAATLIGKRVLVPGDKISLGTQGDTKVATPFGIDIISPASNVEVTILDASGKAVRSVSLGPQAPGVVSITWDGKGEGDVGMPDGAYSVQVSAVGTDNQAVGVHSLMSGEVGSVVTSGKEPRLDLGLLGLYGLDDVKKIM